MSDVFTFECDLDRENPADRRAALSVQHDGEHMVFNLSRFLTDAGREVYLSPERAGQLGELLMKLSGAEVERPEGDAVAGAALLAVLAVVLSVAALIF